MVKKRGLGRSLDALLVGSSSMADDTVTAQLNERLADLPVSDIQRGKYQPRIEMDPTALEELAHSIKAQGIIQPIVVRPVLGGRYEIIAGERRWRAAQLAGLTTVPALIKEIPDEAAVAIALIENIQREGLNPVEEAIAFQRLLNEFDMTHQQVAEAVGKSRAAVSNTLRLLALPETVKTLLMQGSLEMGHARALLVLPEALQLEVADKIIQQHLSVRDTEEWVRRLQGDRIPKVVSKPPMDPDLVRLEQQLTHQLMLNVSIRHTTKGHGKLIIHYRNLTELDNVLSHFQVSEEDET